MDTRSLESNDCSHGETGREVLGVGIMLLFRLLSVLTMGNTEHPSATSFHHPPRKLRRAGNHPLGSGKYGRRH